MTATHDVVDPAAVPPAAPDLARETIPSDEPSLIAECIAFLEASSRQRHPSGPIRRFNQGRAAGCVDAVLTIPALPAALQVGLFAGPATYQARIRFANAGSSTDKDKDVRGMAIAVLDVPGENLTPGAGRQDFVLNSHPVMVAPDTREFLAFLRANERGGLTRVLYFLRHPGAARIGLAARQNHTCHLDIDYWSTTPYLFGDGRAVKYIVRPCSTGRSQLPEPLTDTYLTDALRSHLAAGEACFELLLQFQTDAARMPIEDASVEWSPAESPYVPVARITIPPQAVGPPDDASCETLAFSPWHALPAHRPLGSMNRARRAIYPALAALRASRR